MTGIEVSCSLFVSFLQEDKNKIHMADKLIQEQKSLDFLCLVILNLLIIFFLG